MNVEKAQGGRPYGGARSEDRQRRDLSSEVHPVLSEYVNGCLYSRARICKLRGEKRYKRNSIGCHGACGVNMKSLIQ